MTATSKNTLRKTALWSERLFVIEFNKRTSEVINTTELCELLVEMKPSIDRVAKKYAVKLQVDLDDTRQAAYLVLMELLKSWDPTLSKWSTYVINYLGRRLISMLRPHCAGYKGREILECELEGNLQMEDFTGLNRNCGKKVNGGFTDGD